MSRKIKKYGWIPDLLGHRDHLYAAPLLAKLLKEPICIPVDSARTAYVKSHE